MPLLKTLRRNPLINALGRNGIRILKHGGLISDKTYHFLFNRWPVSGEVKCRFSGIDFSLYNECDDGHLNYFYYGRSYHEAKDLRLFLILAQHAGTIVDIGANTGIFSVLSSLVNPQAKIYPVEPYETNFRRLSKNIRANRITNIHPKACALGDGKASLAFFIPKNNTLTDVSSISGEFSKSFYPGSEWKPIRVNQVTLDMLSEETGGKIDLIKCDVETYEMNVFKGAGKVLREHRPLILFESIFDETRQSFFNALLSEYHYYLYIILEAGLVRLENGYEENGDGLNFLMSPVKTPTTFLPYARIYDDPHTIFLRTPPATGKKVRLI